ncbi:hypothetical protein NDN08_004525 [Rhodosorus marinus]|uniref:NmrA-like domain-containing protein n=1 Tax=Rhodosorus marinus TaxID=101924 RepID=A0AAV8UQI7_9RHOD|nr:hypothetical protein NDN08_004525 [Rhodosorus marinus]
MEKKTLMVIGATGTIGMSTCKALSALYDEATMVIKAGVRNPETATALAELPGINVVKAEMGDAGLAASLVGVDCLFIVSPGVADRAPLVLKTMKSASTAGVKHVMVVSVLNAGTDSVFGRQFKFIEDGIKLLGFEWTILRLPLFMENYWGFKDSIVSQSAIYCPVDRTAPYTPTVTENVGQMAAKIMSNPAPHTEMTYKVTAPAHTFGEVADAFTASMGKEISYVQVPYESAKQAFMGMGFQEWQADGIMDLYHGIDEGVAYLNDTGDYEAVMGVKQPDVATWVAGVAPYFV